MMMNYLRQSQKGWDAWILTETWRPNRSEVVDFEAEDESDEETDHTKNCKGNEEVEDTKENDKQASVSPRRMRHCLFGCGGKTARGVAIVINARHAKGAEMIVVNENVCAVNVKFHGQKTCIIAVYMPHASKCSDEQEVIY